MHASDPELFEALLQDPVASVLFEMYGLVAPQRKEPGDGDAPAAFIGLEALEATIPASPRSSARRAPAP